MNKEKVTNLVVGPVSTNCWIYAYDGKAAIIDPGDEADRIISAVKKSSLDPSYILLTHGHFDHIMAIQQIIDAFPNQIKVAIHSDDAQYLGPDSYEAHRLSVNAAIGAASFMDMFWKETPSPDIILGEGSEIGPFTVLHLPGHSPGSAAFWDKEAKIIFTGDTLFAGAYGRTDLPGGNERQIFESLKRLSSMDTSITVYPGHGDITTIGQEKRGFFDLI